MPVSFSGSANRTIQKSLGATLTFGQSGTTVFQQSLSGTLDFTGGFATLMVIPMALSAALSFGGSLATTIATNLMLLASALSFTGQQNRSVRVAPFLGGLSFAGAVAGIGSFKRTLSATVTFTGSFVRGRLLTAALAFTGSLLRGRLLTAALSFVGDWTGNKAAQLMLLVSNLSFTTAFTTTVPFFTQAFTAAITFSGQAAKRSRSTLTGGLSFAGSFLAGGATVLSQAFTASVGFTGQVTRSLTRTLTAHLTTGGQHVRAITHSLAAAALALVGQINRQRPLVLNAALTFSGSIGRGLGRALTAQLSLAGKTGRTMHRALAAAVSFVGNFAHSGAFTFVIAFEASLDFTGTLLNAITDFIVRLASIIITLVRPDKPDATVQIQEDDYTVE